MTGNRMVRGSKARYLLYLACVFVFGVVIYFFHGDQIQLNELRSTYDKCQQQQESLSAQLQVIFEYKLRLEKSLQTEKLEHQQQRQQLELKYAVEQRQREKENLESLTKYNSIQQELKMLQTQHSDLEEQCSQTRTSASRTEEALANLQTRMTLQEKSLNDAKNDLVQLEAERQHLETQISANQLERHNLQAQIQKLQDECSLPIHKRENLQDQAAQVLAIPNNEKTSSKRPLQEQQQQQPQPQSPSSSTRSPTPIINPEAIMSYEKGGPAAALAAPAPQHEAPKEEDPNPEEAHVLAMPAVLAPEGVVPPPKEGVLQAAGEVEAGGVGELWHWGGHVEPHRPAPAPLAKPAHPGHGGDGGLGRNQYDYKDGNNIEVEEEEDEDVDQDDDFPNGGAGAGMMARNHPRNGGPGDVLKPPPPAAPIMNRGRDSIMVNPK